LNQKLVQGASVKSITIHGLDSRMVEGIERRAKERGTNLNKTIKELIAQSLGLRHESSGATTTPQKE
jgi:hypothetical protein